MKIDIYTLLGLVKDGKAPKKIKYKNNIYEYDGERQNYCSPINMIWDFLIGKDIVALLDDEVEILDEPKKIEKISWGEKESLAMYFTTSEEILARRTEKLKSSLNELIDKINNLKEK